MTEEDKIAALERAFVVADQEEQACRDLYRKALLSESMTDRGRSYGALTVARGKADTAYVKWQKVVRERR